MARELLPYDRHQDNVERHLRIFFIHSREDAGYNRTSKGLSYTFHRKKKGQNFKRLLPFTVTSEAQCEAITVLWGWYSTLVSK